MSTTKGNEYGEQEEVEQRDTHTRLDVLQRNMLIRMWIAPYLSIYFANEYLVCSDSKKQSIPSKNERIV